MMYRIPYTTSSTFNPDSHKSLNMSSKENGDHVILKIELKYIYKPRRI